MGRATSKRQATAATVIALLCTFCGYSSALPQATQAPNSTVTSVVRATATSVSLPGNFSLPDPTASATPQNESSIPPTRILAANPSLPDFALSYAPVMYLHANESYFPSSLQEHLNHTFPWIDYTPMNNVPQPLTLENLNFSISTSLYLSVPNPAQEPRPDWLYSTYGKPDSSGYSGGNVTVIAVNKSESIQQGVIDVYYFLFYSFNDGDNVGGQKYGNHISDVEYIMVRFYSGSPRFVFFSQHQDGEAYEYSVVQKDSSGRPIAYSAIGGHANYPVAGTFQLVPGLIGLLEDRTSPGYRWDVLKNYNGYWWSGADGFIQAGGSSGSSWAKGPPGIGYLQQTGKWGNRDLPADNPNQRLIFGKEVWSGGATGPIDPSKSLWRTWLCVSRDCTANVTLPATSDLQAGQVKQPSSAAILSPYWTMLIVLALSLIVIC